MRETRAHFEPQRSRFAPRFAKTLLLVGALVTLGTSCRFLSGGAEGLDTEFSTMFGSPEGAYLADKRWDEAAENEFSAWIEQLGRERELGTCQKLGQCLTNRQANSLWSEEDKNLSVFADCADVPLLLRAYFAYKTKRPFQYVSRVSGGRYSEGNTPTAFKGFADHKNINSMLQAMSNEVHSGFFRMPPNVENGDTYPIEVSRESVRPGTVFYDPNGHVLVVYRVEDNGNVKLMDGHPDNSLTISPFGEKFARGNASQGGGFRAWRWVNIETISAPQKRYKLVRTPNSASRFFHATEQYQKEYAVNNTAQGNYYAWVRAKLVSEAGTWKVRPVEEFHDQLLAICNDIVDRIMAVKDATAKGMHQKSHPGTLPENIYGSTGEWETYSTPSRDARLRMAIRGLHHFAKDTVQRVGRGDETMEFRGSARMLASLYRDTWNTLSNKDSCRFQYTNSSGNTVSLALDTVMNRIYDLSFDPYHCPEMRWGAKPPRGATPASPDFASCQRDATKEDWYWKETRLRNTLERAYGEPTPYDAGPANAEDIHIPNLLGALATSPGSSTTLVQNMLPTAINNAKISAITPDGVDLGTLPERCAARTGLKRWDCIDIRGCGYNGNTKECFVLTTYKTLLDAARSAGKISPAGMSLVEEE